MYAGVITNYLISNYVQWRIYKIHKTNIEKEIREMKESGITFVPSYLNPTLFIWYDSDKEDSVHEDEDPNDPDYVSDYAPRLPMLELYDVTTSLFAIYFAIITSTDAVYQIKISLVVCAGMIYNELPLPSRLKFVEVTRAIYSIFLWLFHLLAFIVVVTTLVRFGNVLISKVPVALAVVGYLSSIVKAQLVQRLGKAGQISEMCVTLKSEV